MRISILAVGAGRTVLQLFLAWLQDCRFKDLGKDHLGQYRHRCFVAVRCMTSDSVGQISVKCIVKFVIFSNQPKTALRHLISIMCCDVRSCSVTFNHVP